MLRTTAAPGSNPPAEPGAPAARDATGRTPVLMTLIAALALVTTACSDGSGGAAATSGSGAATSSTASDGAGNTDAPGTATTSGTGGGAGGAASATSSTPPAGSGASVEGITPTTPPPLVRSGSSRTEQACLRIYPAVTNAVSAWNAANARGGDAALRRATVTLTRGAATAVPIARDSGDRTLLTLTTVVAGQLRKAAQDHLSGRDVQGEGLNRSASALWAYCRLPR